MLNAFIECPGKGQLIVNGLPNQFDKGKWDMQHRFAPQIEGVPVLETADGRSVTKEAHVKGSLEYTMEELLDFYATFFDTELTDDKVAAIIDYSYPPAK